MKGYFPNPHGQHLREDSHRLRGRLEARRIQVELHERDKEDFYPLDVQHERMAQGIDLIPSLEELD